MFSKTTVAAMAFAAFAANGASAQDTPRWDPMVEQALVRKLQNRLPDMRPAYDVHHRVPARAQQKPLSLMEQLATMDAAGQHPPRYNGRIAWM